MNDVEKLMQNIPPESFRPMFLQGNFKLIEDLMGGLSHDMKQPLNVTKILAQSLLRDIAKGRLDNDNLQQNLKKVVTQVDMLTESVDKLRGFFRTKGAREIGRVSFKQVIDESVAIFGTQFTNYGIALDVGVSDALADFPAKGGEFKMVLVCLMSTAKKWLERTQGGERKVRLSAHPAEGCLTLPGVVVLKLEIRHEAGATEDVREASGTDAEPMTIDDAMGLWLAREVISCQKGEMNVSNPQKDSWVIEVKLPVLAAEKNDFFKSQGES